MDQSTHDVRMTNWLNIISQCQNRPAGISAKQWLAENDVNKNLTITGSVRFAGKPMSTGQNFRM